jgi:hypothetical protein
MPYDLFICGVGANFVGRETPQTEAGPLASSGQQKGHSYAGVASILRNKNAVPRQDSAISLIDNSLKRPLPSWEPSVNCPPIYMAELWASFCEVGTELWKTGLMGFGVSSLAGRRLCKPESSIASQSEYTGETIKPANVPAKRP